jgi:hypothetical protein
VPSKEHLEFGETGKLVVSFASRTSFALGGRLYFLGPLAGGVTLLFLLWNAWLVARKHRAGLISSI